MRDFSRLQYGLEFLDSLLHEDGQVLKRLEDFANDADVGAFFAYDAFYDSQYVSLQHADVAHCARVARVVVPDGVFAEAFDEEHDVRAGVHVGAFELLEDAGVEVFVHFTVLQRVESGLLERRVGCAEVGEQRREALTDLERVGHGGARACARLWLLWARR